MCSVLFLVALHHRSEECSVVHAPRFVRFSPRETLVGSGEWMREH